MGKETIKINPEDMEIISPVSIDRSNKQIPIETIIEYKNRGLSLSEIEKLIGCSKQNVSQRLQEVGYDKNNLEHFKKNRKEVFAFIQSKMLNSIDKEEIKRMPVAQRVLCSGILYDKEEKEGEKIVETVNYGDLKAVHERLRNERETLEKIIDITPQSQQEEKK
jgi:DNA-binding transcriptional regulator GbsR (MarR family)